jgi:adenosylcobinamide-phosphate synthase
MSGAALAAGYVMDVVLGDPRRRHPVAGFGELAQRAEAAVYGPSRSRGVLYTGGLVIVAAVTGELAARAAARTGLRRPCVLAAVTWASLGGRSLTRAATRLGGELEAGDLDAARSLLPSLCGRDPQHLDGAAMARATVESVAENTSDAVVGALLWGAVAGPGGVMAYRAANTLDAMVGHRSARYADFGWAAAKLDDAMNWPAARLAAMLTALCAAVVGGAPDTTWRIVRRDGAKHPSPNAGRIEAAFAGGLGVRLGGPLTYGGVAEVRPTLGEGDAPSAADIRRAVRLSRAVGATAAVTCATARLLLTRLRQGPAR